MIEVVGFAGGQASVSLAGDHRRVVDPQGTLDRAAPAHGALEDRLHPVVEGLFVDLLEPALETAPLPQTGRDEELGPKEIHRRALFALQQLRQAYASPGAVGSGTLNLLLEHAYASLHAQDLTPRVRLRFFLETMRNVRDLDGRAIPDARSRWLIRNKLLPALIGFAGYGDTAPAVAAYRDEAAAKSERDRQIAKDKTGVFTGSYDLEAAYASMSAVYTNKAPGGVAYRCSFRVTEAMYFQERMVQAAADDLGMDTLGPRSVGGTDHGSFDRVGLPGFQFMQDRLEYNSRTHHSNMDFYDRVQAEDVIQQAVVAAVFAYNAAMRDEKLPRKPMPRKPPEDD